VNHGVAGKNPTGKRYILIKSQRKLAISRKYRATGPTGPSRAFLTNRPPHLPTPPDPTSLPLFFFNKTQHTNVTVSHPRPIHLSQLPPNSTPSPSPSPWLPLRIRSLYLSQRTRPISFSVFPTRLARSRSGPRSFRRVRTS
jgi:hypothetical protein